MRAFLWTAFWIFGLHVVVRLHALATVKFPYRIERTAGTYAFSIAIYGALAAWAWSLIP